MTHLFAADEADGGHTLEQLARLDESLSRISAAGLFAEWLNVGGFSYDSLPDRPL